MTRSSTTSPAYNLLPEKLLASIPPIGATSEQSDPMLYVKWFTPDSCWTWYVAEYSPEHRIAFGYVIGFEAEWGSFSLDEIRTIHGSLGLPVERDLHFTPCRYSGLRKG